jgi:hypothetical protein
LRGLRLDTRNLHVLAEIQQESQTLLCLIASKELLPVRQLVSGFLSIHVNQVTVAHVAQCLSYLPTVVFGNCNSIQFHALRPKI